MKDMHALGSRGGRTEGGMHSDVWRGGVAGCVNHGPKKGKTETAQPRQRCAYVWTRNHKMATGVCLCVHWYCARVRLHALSPTATPLTKPPTKDRRHAPATTTRYGPKESADRGTRRVFMVLMLILRLTTPGSPSASGGVGAPIRAATVSLCCSLETAKEVRA